MADLLQRPPTAPVLAGQPGLPAALAQSPVNPAVATMSRSQKAAAVLLAVGADASELVLQHLSEGDVEKVALEIATMGSIPPDHMQAILTEFYQEAVAHGQLISGGEQHARDLLRRWKGDEADEIVDRLLATVRTTPFHFLRFHDAAEIAQHLREEHPQTIALVLAHLPTKLGAQILAGLEPHQQGEVALRVATMDPSAPEVVARVEDALAARLGGQARRNGAASNRSGVKELAHMLNQSDRGTERAILGSLESTSPDLAEEVRSLMFVFEDIVVLDDRSMQEVLRQIDPVRLALALKGVSGEVHEKIMRNLSERARESLAEEIDLLGPARVRDVEAAQSEIVRQIRRLEESGAIQINRGGEGDLVE